MVEYLELNSYVDQENVPKEITWSTEDEIKTSAVSTGMKKVFEAVKNSNKNGNEASYSRIIEEVLAASAAKRKGRTVKNKRNIQTFIHNINTTNEMDASSISKEVLKPISNTNKKLKMSLNNSVNFREVSGTANVSDIAFDAVKNSIHLSSPDVEEILASSSSTKKEFQTVEKTNKKAKTASFQKNGDFEDSSAMSTDIMIEYEGVGNSKKVNETVPNVSINFLLFSCLLKMPLINAKIGNNKLH